MKEDCFHHRAVLTEHQLLGMPVPLEVRRHLSDCEPCRLCQQENEEVIRTLAGGGPNPPRTAPPSISTGAPPAHLRELVMAQLSTDRSRAQHQWVRTVLGVAAAILLLLALIVPFRQNHEPDAAVPNTTHISMNGRMVERQWGTEVPVTLTGLQPERTYRVMAQNSSGARLAGGSLRGNKDSAINFRLMTAMPRTTITALVVEDESGRQLTTLPVTHHTARTAPHETLSVPSEGNRP